ncbi:phage portal protein [Sphingomonas sp. KR1UV-12]|uniref:Phage portal protein n=1 Tax=Sphingomonas aurea TaxID=3063994 RepID=A0ABT9ELG2_9SPHN|nr:phage portal protein [Sphingomonas sp. KR1UV-12]MDP1027794.1 phage portal protein [Sphingomonas sp. KR1UV-12]
MKLFGRKAGREQSRPALAGAVSRSGVPILSAWPRSYEAQVRESYAGNAVAQRAVRVVADTLAGAPLEGSDPALVALATARSGGQALLATVAAHLLLHGNAYLQVLRDAEGEVAELYALRPERVAVETDAGGWPAAYRYKVGERVVRLAAGPERPAVIHIRSFNPLDDHYGQGCLGAAAGAVAIHNAAARWAKGLLDNAARPSGALVYDPGDGSALSSAQYERLKAELDAFSGAGNAGRPMLLEGGLKWQALSLSPAELDFAGTKAAAAREIALAFGVPPMLLGLPGDATYANYREAGRALWRMTVLPLADEVLTSIAQGLSGWFEGARLAVNLDRVTVLAEERALQWQAIGGADFLTGEEKRGLLGLV